MNSRTAPSPRFVPAADGVQIATYEWGDPGNPTVLLVHGFASSALANWHNTGWTRDLIRAGYHVVAVDQRGHGASDKPHSSDAYAMTTLADDITTVLDAFLINETFYVGYSLGARVGWQAGRELGPRITRLVLGGIPDGDPLKRFQVADARAHIDHGHDVTDRLTGMYLDMAKALPSNDLSALVALVEGMRDGEQPGADNAPDQFVLFATGSDDHIIEASRALAVAAPHGTFFEIPGRNHFNAPPSRAFRDAALAFFHEPLS